ncbi:hypothetical protein FIBSPDRAFT_886880 [Athelia psychrophila]|uniref:Uncharacterized protein n=1 Tax=Athelia psychrophila TaxID=1759441 RepID=A0A166QBV6_9AGAM|nr:hypothetical protein FIBSPDRAFT_886880 [Fibularhizoctonia sp. CBS 109695]
MQKHQKRWYGSGHIGGVAADLEVSLSMSMLYTTYIAVAIYIMGCLLAGAIGVGSVCKQVLGRSGVEWLQGDEMVEGAALTGATVLSTSALSRSRPAISKKDIILHLSRTPSMTLEIASGRAATHLNEDKHKSVLEELGSRWARERLALKVCMVRDGSLGQEIAMPKTEGIDVDFRAVRTGKQHKHLIS